MPRKKTKSPDIDMNPIVEEIVTQIRAICEEHQETAAEVLARSETNKLGWGFHATIDNSEATIVLTVSDKFGENYTSKRVSQLDPDQGKFEAVLKDAKAKKPKKSAQELDEAEG